PAWGRFRRNGRLVRLPHPGLQRRHLSCDQQPCSPRGRWRGIVRSVARGLRAVTGGDGDLPYEALDDRALTQRAATDIGAFGELYRRHVDAIHAFSWRRSGSRDVAEDVTAATFERALAAMHTFEWRNGGFAPWPY